MDKIMILCIKKNIAFNLYHSLYNVLIMRLFC